MLMRRPPKPPLTLELAISEDFLTDQAAYEARLLEPGESFEPGSVSLAA